MPMSDIIFVSVVAKKVSDFRGLFGCSRTLWHTASKLRPLPPPPLHHPLVCGQTAVNVMGFRAPDAILALQRQ